MTKGKQIGLFFGSFNPIHTGHLIIAEYMATRTALNQVWFVVSPHNPLKAQSSLARDLDRLQMVRLAIEDNTRLKASNIEFGLPKPSYTIDTMAYLHEKYPQHEFSLIMGADNLKGIQKWKNYELLLKRYAIHVYQRKGSRIDKEMIDRPGIHVYDVPLLDISATMIRDSIRQGLSIRYMVPDPVFEFLAGSKLYKQ